MHHYTYMTSDGKRYYIGSRSCKCEPFSDAYMGSHYDKTFEPTYKTILGLHADKTDKIAAEIYWQRLFKVAENPLFVNLVYQTSTKFDRTGSKNKETHRKRISEAKMGHVQSESTKKKIARTKMSDKVYLWVNEKTGEEFVGCMFDFIKKYDLRTDSVKRVVLGNRRQNFGWLCVCLL